MTSGWQDYRAALVRFVRSRVNDSEAAEDIVHDVLVKAYARRDTLKNAEKVDAWLYQMTRHAIVDHYRAKRPSDELPEDLVAPEKEGSAREELARCLTTLIEHLPAGSRQAIELSELQGLTQKETATRLGISLSGAKSRVQRGRAQLHDLLIECCRVERDVRGGIMDYEPSSGCTHGSESKCGGGCASPRASRPSS
jgi:RNA polymerase sigma-70 factor, ECF subfamily